MSAGSGPLRLLVVGAGGFVGGRLAARAAREGHRVLGADLGGPPGLLRFDLARDRIVPLLPRAFLRGTSPAWAVVCAAESRIERCAREPAATRLVNVTGTTRLVEDLAGVGFRSVFVSSDHVFDGRRGGYDERDRPAPATEYGRQKLEVEEWLRAGQPRSLVVRLSRVVSADPAERHVFSEWLGQVRRGEPLRCVRGQVFSPTAVDDVAAGILAAVRLGLAGVRHLAAPEAWSRVALARRFLAVTGLRAPVIALPGKAFGFSEPRPLRTSLDAGRLAREARLTFTPMDEVLAGFRDRLA